eukprot:1920843-Pyramimonas_sp.AAC.1
MRDPVVTSAEAVTAGPHATNKAVVGNQNECERAQTRETANTADESNAPAQVLTKIYKYCSR